VPQQQPASTPSWVIRRLLAVFALLMLGCGGRALPGTDDFAVAYSLPDDSHYVATIAAQLRERLAAAEVPADVEALDAHRLRVVASRVDVQSAEGWIAWRGGISVYRANPAKDGQVQALAEVRCVWAFAMGKRLAVVVDDVAKLRTLAAELDDAPIWLAANRFPFWKGPLGQALGPGPRLLDLPMGSDVGAYRSAYRWAERLDAVPLPLLSPGPEVTPSHEPWLAAATLLVPLAVGLVWLLFIRRFDRAWPEPWWLLLATFGFGGVAQLAAGFIELTAWRVSPFLDPRVMALDASPGACAVDFIVTLVVVGFVEEGLKLLAAWSLAMHRREFDEPIDGIVYGSAAAIGFAAMEGFAYFSRNRLSDSLVVGRCVETYIGHAMYASVWGYAFGMRLVAKARVHVWPWFLVAAVLHALWDTSIQCRIPHATLALNAVTTTIFIVLTRRSLRWGTTGQVRGEAPVSSRRALFRVGARGRFAVAVVGMYVAGALLIGMAHSGASGAARGTVWSSPVAYALAALFALSALGVTAFLPLDVAVDEMGVTFAGSLWRWSDIVEATRAGRMLRLRGARGTLSVGPGDATTLDRLASAIDGYVGPAPSSEQRDDA
jgi:RsiW-degrading membrane proteinase PrsW (M82 family)